MKSGKYLPARKAGKTENSASQVETGRSISFFSTFPFRLIGIGFLLAMGCFLLSQLFFWFYNPHLSDGARALNLAWALMLAFRFNASTICTLLSAWLLLVLVKPRPARWHIYLTGILFIVPLSLGLWLDVADSAYFGFTSRRTSADVLGMVPDIMAQAVQLVYNYWGQVLLSICFSAVLARFYGALYRFAHQSSTSMRWYGYVLASLFVVALTVGLIRGSLQLKPLLPGHAFGQNPTSLGHLSLNTPFVFIKSIGAEAFPEHAFYPTLADAKAILQRPQPTPLGIGRGQNVVIIILESFGREYMGYGHSWKGYTPFLDSLAHQSLFWPEAYANGRRSMEALPSILAGLPSLAEVSFISSSYVQNELIGLPALVRAAGYQTAFFHGGRNGTMGFDHFSGKMGFSRYYGQTEYKGKKEDYDGNWGIYDEPFLDFTARELNGLKTPFLTGIFTLSSHQPYTIPSKYTGRFPKGTLPIHESLGYADYALRRFFALAQKQPWFKNTLFVVTADHTQQQEHREYGSEIGVYRVPLLLYHPTQKLQADTTLPRQHADVMATLTDYLGVSAARHLPYGTSALRNTQSRIWLYGSNQYYLVADANEYLRMNMDGKPEANTIPDSALATRQLRAAMQLYGQGLKENKLY